MADPPETVSRDVGVAAIEKMAAGWAVNESGPVSWSPDGPLGAEWRGCLLPHTVVHRVSGEILL